MTGIAEFSRFNHTIFCRDSISFRGGAKSTDICLLLKIKGYLCIVVGNRPRETLQSGAVFRWSNRGRQSLLPKSNSKRYSHLTEQFDSWWYHLKDSRLQQCRRLFRFRRANNFNSNTGFSLHPDTCFSLFPHYPLAR